MQVDSGRWNRVRRIYEIIGRLRSESGCPWDRKQTPESVQTYLIEEAHEAAAAVRAGLAGEAAEELGDLLFMVLFLIHLYEERQDFRLEEVCDLICEKMIRRHPHVFGDTTVGSTQEVKDNWEKIKAGEKASSGKEDSIIPESLPALMRAYRMLSRTSGTKRSGLDDTGSRAAEFVSRSRTLGELVTRGAPVSGELLGDLLLALVDIARIQGFRAEDCLHERLKVLNGNESADA